MESLTINGEGLVTFFLPPGFGQNISVHVFVSPLPIDWDVLTEAYPWVEDVAQPPTAFSTIETQYTFVGEAHFSFAAPRVDAITLWRDAAFKMYFAVFGSSFHPNELLSVYLETQHGDTEKGELSASDPSSDTRFVFSTRLRVFKLYVTIRNQRSNTLSYNYEPQLPLIFRVQAAQGIPEQFPTSGLQRGSGLLEMG